jgi:hypothetical protein
MTSHTIQLSEKTYALLLKQAARLQTTPEDVIERVLANDLTLLTDDIDQDRPSLDKPAATAEALAAVQRLTSLFADVSILDLDAILDDPMLTLENSTLLDQAL